MRHATTLAAAACLVAAGCRDKPTAAPEPPSPETSIPETNGEKPHEEPAPVDAKTPAAIATSTTGSFKRQAIPLLARLAWTGTHFAIVWPEVPEPAAQGEDGATACDVRDLARPGEEQEDIETILLSEFETFTIHMALVDGRTAEAEDPVTLEGAGTGPRALSGPALSLPAWKDGALALAWSLWNEEAATGVPVRYVLGGWKPDGTSVGEPTILAKDQVHHAYPEHAPVRLLAAGNDLSVFWAVERTPAEAGCKDMHGLQDGVALASVAADGSVDLDYICGDVMMWFDVHGFGDETLVVTHNEHIGYHTLFTHAAAEAGAYYESTNPYERHLATSGGYLVWYDELDEEFELKRHCLDIVSGEGSAVCVRPRSIDLTWSETGLAVTVRAKDGEIHDLPLAPGDHVPLKLLRRALVKKVPFEDALWSGHSIGLAWTKGRQVRFKVVGPDGLEKSGE